MEMFTYLIKSAAILSIFYIVYVVLLRKDTLFTAKRHYFIGGIFAALVLPLVTFTKTIEKNIPFVETTDLYETPIAALQPMTEASSPVLSQWQIATILYLLGVGLLCIRFGFQLYKLIRLIRSYPSEKHGNHTFVKADEYVAPFSFFNYIVYNPTIHTKEELAMILAHEKVHASQWHSIDLLLAHFVRMLQWGNPFSWWYKKSLEQNLEFIADSETVSQIESKKSYQLTLVRASSPHYAPALTTQFYQSFIKKRIIMLNKQHSKKRNLLKTVIILPLLALFLWSFNVTEVVHYIELDHVPAESELPKSSVASITEHTAITTDEMAVKTKSIANKKDKESHIDNPSNHISKAEVSALTPSEELPITKNEQKTFSQEFRITINKNTSDAQLKKMKDELKRDHDIDLSYRVVRNGIGEITSINMSYSGGSNNGSYSISDDNPIEEFQFYMDGEGRTRFYSEAMEERRQERLERRQAQIEEREEEREERLTRRMEEREERLAHLEEEREERISEMKERHEEMEERHEEMEKQLHKNKEKMEKRHKKLAKVNRKMHRKMSHGQNNHYDSHDSEEHLVITKNTSDAALQQIKSDLAVKGISFSYKRLKRNSRGEITSIKIDIDNNKGSKTQASHRGDADDPINDIVIEI